MVTDKDVIETCRAYGLTPGTLKFAAFTLFDRGYNQKEAKYLLRRFKNRRYRYAFSQTISHYYWLWRRAQAAKRR